MNGGAAAAAAMIQAIKAAGTLVRVEPPAFAAILARQDEGLVVHAEGGVFTRNYQYLTGYRGLCFFTKSPTPLHLPESCLVVRATRIWMPA
jgi:hypothetical protein